MKDLVPIDNEKNDAFTRILRFYDAADVVLTADEEIIHNRWIYCDALLRSRKFKSDDIIEKIVDKYGVSKFTAQNDIRQTYSLFGQTRVISKQYVLSNHIEDIQLQIERIKYDKSLAHLLPKLDAELTRAANSLPDEPAKKQLPTPNIYIGSVNINSDKTAGLSIEEAKEKWKQKKANRSKDEYTDYEDVK